MNAPMRRTGRALRTAGVLLLMAVVAAFCLFPIYWIVATSFKATFDVFSMPPKWIFKPTLDAYVRVFRLTSFAQQTGNSVFISIVAVVLSTAIGTLAAYGLTRFEIRGKKHLSFYMLSTRFAPPIGFVIPFYLIFSNMGIIDRRFGLIIVYIAFNLSFTVWMMKGVFEGIPIEYEEAAMMDGMRRGQILRGIVMRLSKSGIAATAIFAMIITWNEFVFALNLTMLKSKTLPTVIPKFMAATDIQWNVVSAAGTMVIVPMIIFSFFVQKYIIRGLTMGAVRG